MKSKIDILLLGMVIALMIGGIASSEAAAVEAPYWSLGGKRLSQGEHEAISIKGTDPPDIVFVVVNGPVITNVFVTAENIFFVGGSILGSYPFSDGKAEGTMKFEKPSLWAKASSGKYEEQTKCIVEEFQSKPLAGQMFLEGKREETQKPVLQFESIKSQKGEETRSLLAEITIKAKGGKAGECQPIGESTSKTYKLEGKFGGQIRPEQTETVVTNIIYPEKPVVHVWQPLTQFVAEETLGLSVEGNTAALTGEFENELISKKSFGGFSHATWHASGTHWSVESKELVGNETRMVEGSLGTTKLVGTIGGISIDIECTLNKFANAIIEASGRSKAELALGTCRVKQVEEKEKEKEVAACSVKEPVKLKTKDQLVKPGSHTEDEFKPESGSLYAEIKVEGSSCLFKGVYSLEGTMTAELPGGETEGVVHEVKFTKAGSNLKLNKVAATFTGIATAQL